MPPPPTQPPEIVPPPSLDDVQFIERLGAGLGAGRFMARLQGVSSPVSLLIEHAPHTSRHDFIEWARRLAQVTHATIPRLVRVEDVLSPAYVAFDHVPGRTLAEALDAADPAHPLSPLDALSITLQVASGIRAAHRQGLTHGGLAPRTVVLSERPGAADGVRITGWVPCPEPLDEDVRKADVKAIASMLHHLLTGMVPPSEMLEQRRGETSRLEGNGGRFDDIVLGWEDARRDLGGLTPLVTQLLERADVHADIDRLIDLIVPYYRRLLDEEYAEVDAALAQTQARADELARWQRQERELESKLRWVKQWLREHADEVAPTSARLGRLEQRAQKLRNVELEMAMLLDRRLPPTTRPPRPSAAVAALEPVPTTPPRPDDPPAPAVARTAPPAPLAPQPMSQAPAERAPEPVVPGPAPALAPASPPAAEKDDRPAPRRTGRLDQPSRRMRDERSLAERRRWVTRAAAGLGLLAVAGGLWRLIAGGDAGYESRPVPKFSATSGPPSAAAPASSAGSVEPALAFASAPATDVVSAAPSAPTPPPGMLYVPPGLLSPGLAPAQVDAVLAQCRLDFGDRPQAKACLPELFKDEAPAAPSPVKGFFIDQYEVSQARYAVCVTRGRCPVLRLHWDLPEQPATGVDLRAAEAFCRMNDARLPTVDEWLYAARGKDARAFPWGDTPVRENGEARANAGAFIGGKRAADREDGHPYAGPIAVFAARGASPFGVANLAGNVREWTSTEVTGSVMVMGGGWKNLGHELRLTRREFLRPTDFAPDLGFRCVRDLP